MRRASIRLVHSSEKRWAVWNGQYRDDVRRFAKGDRDTVTKLAARLVGSPDLFPAAEHASQRSINFVTCHDGFTLRDLVSYGQKHNQANQLGNHDGTDVNHSWNCGAEGPTTDAADSSTPHPAGEELDDDPVVLQWNADAADG